MPTTKINLNGINELDLVQDGTTTAVITSPGVITVTNDLTGEFVTHTLGPLTAGSMVIGNGSGDVTIAPVDYSISVSDALSVPSLVVSLSTPGNAAFSLLNSRDTGGIAWLMESDSGVWEAEVTGSSSPIQAYLFADGLTGIINMILQTIGSSPTVSFLSSGMFGWRSGSLSLDTGMSRSAPATVVIGNGTPGDASGTLKASSLHATSAFSGTITTAALTSGGTQGSQTFVDGILISQVQAT